jgi:ribosomal protein L11 methyltransferase
VEPRYPFVALDVPFERCDELSVTLFDLGATGVEERDDSTLSRGPGAGRITIVGSFETREAAERAIAVLVELDAQLDPRIEEVVGDGWRNAWKEHFVPFSLTPHVTIVPPWVTYHPLRPDELVLKLEPGGAFGTGLHASTALVAELIDERREIIASRDVLDVGTGSGILALVALVLGASHATAIDIDADVIDIVLENAERNGFSDRLEVQPSIEAIDIPFPFVFANIEARILRPMAPHLARVLTPQGLLILSGILAVEHDEIVGIYTSLPRPLVHVTTRRRGKGADEDWVAIVFMAAR